MANAKRRRARKRQHPEGRKPLKGQPKPYEAPPKTGPGQVLEVEQFLEPGQHWPKKRVRNHGEHPLTLAFHRGQLASPYPPGFPKECQISDEERFKAGEVLRNHCEKLGRSGRDPLDMSARGGSLSDNDWQQDSRDFIERLCRRMKPSDLIVVVKFCGEGHQMPIALRAANVLFHPNSACWRVREALDELIFAMGGRRRPTDLILGGDPKTNPA